MMEYKPALDIKAPRARLSQAGVDSDSNLPKHEVPLEVQTRVTQGPHVWASWSRCLLPPDLARSGCHHVQVISILTGEGERKIIWKWMLILMILRPQYS